MNARYVFQCRRSGQLVGLVFRDSKDQSIETQVNVWSKRNNYEVTGYNYYRD